MCGCFLSLPQLDDSLTSRVLMGRSVAGGKSHIDIPVSANDSPVLQRKQWALLKEAFCGEQSGNA